MNDEKWEELRASFLRKHDLLIFAKCGIINAARSRKRFLSVIPENLMPEYVPAMLFLAWHDIYKLLNDQYKRMLWLYIVEGKTMAELGKEFGMNRKLVWHHFQNIIKFANNYVTKVKTGIFDRNTVVKLLDGTPLRVSDINFEVIDIVCPFFEHGVAKLSKGKIYDSGVRYIIDCPTCGERYYSNGYKQKRPKKDTILQQKNLK